MKPQKKVLFLTQIVPYPPDAGPRVKTWNVLRYLAAAGHRIELVTFVRDEERPHLDRLGEVCDQVHPIPLSRSRLTDVYSWAKSLVTGRPFIVERDDLSQMRRTVKKLVRSGGFDIVHVDQITMAQFVLPVGRQNGRGGKVGASVASRPRILFDAHNAVWQVLERMRTTASPLLRPFLALEAQRTRVYEGQVVTASDVTFAVSEADRQALLRAKEAADSPASDPEIHVVPIAVDTHQLIPTRSAENSLQLLTLGTLHYPPNADGVRWFLHDVFPRVQKRVPGVKLTIVGKNPPDDLVVEADRWGSAVSVTGYVRNLDPYMEQAAAMIVPVRAGGGMRVRILEGFARAMPMVTTTVGLEGIDARPGQHILVGDSEEAFANAVIRLLEDRALRDRLAENGRRLAEEFYDWQIVLGGLERAYGRVRLPS